MSFLSVIFIKVRVDALKTIDLRKPLELIIHFIFLISSNHICFISISDQLCDLAPRSNLRNLQLLS